MSSCREYSKQMALAVALLAYTDEPDYGDWSQMDLWEEVVYLASTCRELRAITEHARRRAAKSWAEAADVAISRTCIYLSGIRPSDHLYGPASVMLYRLGMTESLQEDEDAIQYATKLLPVLARERDRLGAIPVRGCPGLLMSMAFRTIQNHLKWRE